ncbi:diguanylate cyclase [Hahella sp. CR1]|uniref:GGDEF domain-containing response regulator n=1 Tax=Hahella sp. CR1 TaxID=2992807 RepID=UPI002441E31E|nr:diguanylate cyclase [Hahella sp. CR1]MDG9669618.1 diguanylate cyclase [Hahella sp. CR1]
MHLKGNSEVLILVIDDSADVIKHLHSILKDDARIIFATNGLDGLNIAKKRQPHLIMLDINMPEMNGYEVCRALKADPQTELIPVVFVTAHLSISHEIEAIEAGAVDYITKPINGRLAKARINAHLTARLHAEMLRVLAVSDGLTGAFNRRFFDETLAGEVRRHQRSNHPLALILLDVDYFKPYNDCYGHLKGDECLVAIVNEMLLAFQRAGEVVARYGGEEFAVILPNTNVEEAKKCGENIRSKIANLNIPHINSEVANCVTVSVGVAVKESTLTICGPDLIKKSDLALYQAKKNGRNQVMVIEL